MSQPLDFIWRVVRCAHHLRQRTIDSLEKQGFLIVDTYLTTGRVQELEEYTIVAKRPTKSKAPTAS